MNRKASGGLELFDWTTENVCFCVSYAEWVGCHICPAHYISPSARHMNQASLCKLRYWGVTTEVILGP